MFLACDDTIDLRVVARTNLSSAMLGNEGFFNSCLTGTGVAVLESPVLAPAFDNVVPALFGAMAYKYYRKSPLLALAPLLAMVTLFTLVPSLTSSTSFMIIPSGALAIGLSYLSYRREMKGDRAQ